MAPNNKELTHDEIWDDSALIDSWNEALDEYKVRLSCRVRQKGQPACCRLAVKTNFKLEIPQHPRKGRPP